MKRLRLAKVTKYDLKGATDAGRANLESFNES